MAPTPVSSPTPADPGRSTAHDFDAGADADGPGSEGGWLRALLFLAVGVALLGVGFWVVKPKPRVEPVQGSIVEPVQGSMVETVTVPPVATTAPTPSGLRTDVTSTPQDVPTVAALPATDGAASATVAAGRLVGAPMSLRLTEGQPATLDLTADAAGEWHLHGYDLERRTRAGEAAHLEFTARQTGRFPLEWHGPRGVHVEAGTVEVYPQ